MNSWETIAAKVMQRRLAQNPMLLDMVKVRDRYNGDYVIPLPNTDDPRAFPATMPAIIANAIDNTALRAASVSPNIVCPALEPDKGEGVRSREYASIRRRALSYTWSSSQWQLSARRAFRHLSGYSTTALVVVPDLDQRMPKVLVRDPLSTYPEPKAPEDLTPPCDVAFVYARSVDWITYRYPEAGRIISQAPSAFAGADTNMWDLCEWIDENDVVIGLLGPSNPDRYYSSDPARWTMELRRWTNRAGCCTAYIPRRVTLDRIQSQVANMVESVDLMAYLTALDIKATEKAIYPDTYIMGKDGQAPKLVNGRWAGGETGEVNLIQGADAVGQLRGTPDPHNVQTIDRLERGANLSMGVVPQMGGETYGALRTGRGIDALSGIAVDPRIQELHEIMGLAMSYCNEIIAETWKGYWPDRRVTGFSNWPSDRGLVDFTPVKHFETNIAPVHYPLPGADVQTVTVTLGQLKGAEAISTRTFRNLHPYIDDPDGEERQDLIEKVRSSMMAGLEQRIVQGGVPPVDMATLVKMIVEGKSPEDALIEVDRLAQQRQAQQAPPPQSGQAVAPEQMPGMANPGEGAEMQPPASIPQTPGGLDNFRMLTQALRSPQQQVGTGVAR